MPVSEKTIQPLAVSDFTNSVKSIIELLEDKYPPQKIPADVQQRKDRPNPWRKGGLVISDVIDNNGSQYVDLVQEGGGVHGIALAGYSFVLEKMGTAFAKMAGTSAGSINTMLLSAVTTRDELRWMQEKKMPAKTGSRAWETDLQYKPEQLKVEDYYETRSEKVVEYLTNKKLSDLVDGHKEWRKIILDTFRGQVKFDNIKGYLRKVKKWVLFVLIALLLLLISGITLLFLDPVNLPFTISRWVYAAGAFVFIAGIIYLITQVTKGRFLYYNAEKFGINPGDDFEKWVQQILESNGINNVAQLKNKMQMEQDCLQFIYMPPAKQWNDSSIKATGAEADLGKLRSELEQIKVKFDTGLMATVPDDIGARNNLKDGLRDQLEDLNWNVIKSAKKISPDSPDKEEWGKALVNILVEMNRLRTSVFDYKEDESDTSASYKKEIAIVSSDITNEMKAEFPAMHKMYWGENIHVSPAKYVRASMAIPGFFKPFRIDYDSSQRRVMEKEWRDLLNIDLRLGDDDKYALLVDGGLLSNFPVNIFFNQDSPLPSRPTVGVKLQFEDDASQNNIDNEKQMLAAMVSTMRYFYDRDFISKHNMFKKTVRSIDTGEIHWLNFDLTDREQIELFFRGALTAAIFLLGNENENAMAGAVQELIQMGKKVPLRNESFSIFKDDNVPTYLTEDNLADVSFNWERYKMERVLLLGEQNMMRNRIKRKAAYMETPAESQANDKKA